MLRWWAVCVVMTVLAGCLLLFREPAPRSTTCTEWLSLPDGSKTELATMIVDSQDVLESFARASTEGVQVR